MCVSVTAKCIAENFKCAHCRDENADVQQPTNGLNRTNQKRQRRQAHTEEKIARHTLGFGSVAAKEIENVVQELSSPRHRPRRSTGGGARAFEYSVLMKISCDRFRMRKIDIMFEKSLSTALILGRKEMAVSRC